MGLKRSAVPAAAGDERRAQPRTVDGLLRALADPDPESRRRAALDLQGRPEALPALVEAFAEEQDPAVRDALLTTLSGHDDEILARRLAELLRSEEPALRNGAVVALRSMPAGAGPVVGGLLADPDPDVRILAVMVLAELAHPLAPSWLQQVVGSDPHENVVASAVDAVIGLGEGAAEATATAARRFPANPFLGYLAGRHAERGGGGGA